MRPARRNGKGEREKRKESRKTKGNAAAASSRNTGEVSGRATGGLGRKREREREGANAAEFVRGQGDTRFTLRGNSGVYSRARVNPGTRYRRIEAGRRRRAGGDKSARGEWRSEIARRFGQMMEFTIISSDAARLPIISWLQVARRALIQFYLPTNV